MFKQEEGTSPTLSFKYGEQTSILIEVRKAVFRISKPLPFVQKSLCTVELTIANTAVEKSISAKLRLQLPVSAGIKRFEMLRGAKWYPATAASKKKSAAVVYKEKEKNREVAVASNLASSNLFEIEVFPLPHNADVKCRLEIMLDSCDAKIFAGSMFPSDSPTKTEIVMEESVAMPTVDGNGGGGGALVGDAFGKTHFVCKIPPIQSNKPTAMREIPRVSVLWDTSASMAEQPLDSRCYRLAELLKEGKTCEIELYRFNTTVDKVGVYSSADACIAAIRKLEYDGGSFFGPVVDFLTDMAARTDAKVDCALVFSDGLDSLGKTPDFRSSIVDFPVHCIHDANQVNLNCLRSLACASVSYPGTVLTSKDDGYVNGVLLPQPVLRSIKTDQNEEAFLGEVADGFLCVPDHRLGSIGRPIGCDGILISGVLKDMKDTACAVTNLVAEVVVNGEVQSFRFNLQKSKSSPASCLSNPSNFEQTHTQLATVWLDEKELCSTLGYIYAEALYMENENFGLQSGMSMKIVQEELAATYGFCSPESSLLMMYEADQFVEHDIVPPLGHPSRSDDKIVEMQSMKANSSLQCGATVGEIGEPKNDTQIKTVGVLARNLKTFLASAQVQPSKIKAAGGLEQQENGVLEERRPERVFDVEEEWFYREEEELDIGGGMDMFGGDDNDDDDDAEECLVFAQQIAMQPCSVGRRLPSSACSQIGATTTAEGGSEEEESRTLTTPADPKQYLETLSLGLSRKGNDNWNALYRSELKRLGGHRAAAPSFFLNTAGVLAKHGKAGEAVQVATNCLETGIEDVQMFRSVGYLILSVGSRASVDVAQKVFDNVRDLAPSEPQSYLDAALARFWRSQKLFAAIDGTNDDAVLKTIEQDISTAQELLARVLTHAWAGRFAEIEWPALILLHYVADFVRDKLHQFTNTTKPAEWPLELNVFQHCVTSLSPCQHPLRCEEFDLALMVWLGWDTDKTDVDLHVKEPAGGEVYYSNKRGVGSLLSRDFTSGYGPEVYILRQNAVGSLPVVGEYEVSAKFFASHQDSSLTGTTSAVVWTIEKTDGNPIIKFNFVRLDAHKQRTHVATVAVEGATMP